MEKSEGATSKGQARQAARLSPAWLRALTPLLLAVLARAAPLPLPDGGLWCHPRPMGSDSLPRLLRQDSLMVNGHLGRARQILVNGQALRTTADGRFADQIPWPADRRLRVQLQDGGEGLDWDLRLAAPLDPVRDPAPQWVDASATPMHESPFRVRLEQQAVLSTAPGASYWIFPQGGVELLADQRLNGWLRLPLALGLEAWTPERRVRILGSGADTSRAEPRLVGPMASARRLPHGDLQLSLPITGDSPPLWREELEEGGRRWRLILENCLSRLDWIEVDPNAGLLHMDWEPRPGKELELRAELQAGTFQGHLVRWEPGRLVLTFQRKADGLKGARIVLDPGHGGEESGCIGASGTEEKQLTLHFAHELKKSLEHAGAEVLMTRETDSTVALNRRVEQSVAWRADLFISLHYNSVGEREDPWQGDGFMVFYWSPWTAEPARLLHAALDKHLPQRSQGVHWRSLGVCRQHACPAILLELGSLAHPDEEARMLDRRYQRRQVRAIRAGLTEWFKTR